MADVAVVELRTSASGGLTLPTGWSWQPVAAAWAVVTPTLMPATQVAIQEVMEKVRSVKEVVGRPRTPEVEVGLRGLVLEMQVIVEDLDLAVTARLTPATTLDLAVAVAVATMAAEAVEVTASLQAHSAAVAAVVDRV